MGADGHRVQIRTQSETSALIRFHLWFLLSFFAGGGLAAAPQGMVVIPSGTFQPFFKGARPSFVPGFYLDQYQVTNTDYLDFVKANPQWRRSAAKRIFADASYLSHWTGDTSVPITAPQSPVTHVSFFAAKAYCAWKGKRLPALAEWEYAAAGDNVLAGHSDSETARILDWYAKPSSPIPGAVGRTRGPYGVFDMHALVWEWVSDFNSVMVSDENRDQGTDRAMFCGGGAQGAKDFRDYASFMRYAFRSSLRGSYTTANLGFRCAKDL